MHHLFFGSIEVLVELSEDRADSPEALLLKLEEALESGELTLEDVAQFLHDYNRR